MEQANENMARTGQDVTWKHRTKI